MKKCESCTSCGMPFKSAADHALGNENIPYCTYCTTQDGKLKSYEEVLQGTTGYFIHSQGLDPKAAKQMAEMLLKKQPAWNKKNHGGCCSC